jgi:signal transduction histidine kinase/DNA-binding NarL/FixJ family response regulator/HPt (histidine-containing phosphotransfer) domain-containing protein
MTSSGVPFAASSALRESWRLRTHDLEASCRLARTALDACTDDPRGTLATWARFQLAAGRIPRGPTAELVAEVAEIREAFAALHDESGVVLTDLARAVLRSMQGEGAAAWQALQEEVAPFLDALHPEFQFFGVIYLTVAALGAKDLLAGLRHAYRALDLARQIDDPGPVALALFNLGYLHLNYGSFHEAIERFGEVMALARQHDLANRRRTTPPSLIVAHIALGDFDQAEGLSERWMAEFGAFPLDNHVLYGRVMAIYLAARSPARWSQGHAWLAELEAEFAARERGEGLGMVKAYLLHVAWAKAALLRAQGRHEEAVRALREAEPYDALCEVTFVHMVVKEELQRACAALGRWQDAHAAMIEFARRQANLLSGANAVRLQALAIQHAVERERIARQKAEESARLKSEFLANMSHELRTPMNAIIGMAHLALATPLAADARDYVEKIQRAGQTLLGLINDILDFSKIEAGKLQLSLEDFELDELIGDVVVVTGHDAAAKTLSWRVEVAPGVPRSLHGDVLRLGQVLVNLVNNAVKFTAPGGAVTLAIVREPEPAGVPAPDAVRLRFEVRDTGIGLSPEQQVRLFQPFVQADGSTSRRYGGTGLGLSISRRLVELMGGRIGVHSELGKGATFHFDVPLAARRPSAPEAAAHADAPGTGGALNAGALPEPDEGGAAASDVSPIDAGGAAPSDAPPVDAGVAAALAGRFAGRRVMLVEDNAVNRQVAGGLLANVGLQVDMAEDGTQALALLGAAPPDHYDLVLMDLQMPHLDGHDTTAAIRADARFDALPIIALTAHAQPAVRARCAAQGMQDFVTKPIAPPELYRVVARWLGADGPSPVRSAARRPSTDGARATPAPVARASAGSAPAVHAPAATPTAPGEALPPSVRGLDVDHAIMLLGGSVPLYRQVLRRFSESQAGFAVQLSRLHALGQRTEALRLAHTLKGLAATIGAAALRDGCAAYELALARVAAAPGTTTGASGATDAEMDAAPPWPDPASMVRALEAVLKAIDEALGAEGHA